MRAFVAILGLFALWVAAVQTTTFKASVNGYNYNIAVGQAEAMRVYHHAAVTYKLANPAATGPLTLTLQAVNTGYGTNVESCADATHVETYWTVSSTVENREILDQLLSATMKAPNIGLSNGANIVTGYGTITGACTVPAGAAIIQTQVIP